MMKYIKENISNALYFVLVAVLLWAAISTMPQGFKEGVEWTIKRLKEILEGN